MTNPLVGLALAHLFLFVVAATFAMVARWRRWRWRPQFAAGIYLVLLVPALTLFRAIGGDREQALLTVLVAVIGLSLVLPGRSLRDRQP